MPVVEITESVYMLWVEYPPQTPSPHRIFHAVASSIEAFENIDNHLLIGFHLEHAKSEVILETVEAGPFKTFLRSIVESLDDEALRTLDWKQLIGSYLVKAKHRLPQFLSDKPKIETKEQLIEVQHNLLEMAERDKGPSTSIVLTDSSFGPG
jgi:hypothetical protein